jgi:hypothetical protein
VDTAISKQLQTKAIEKLKEIVQQPSFPVGAWRKKHRPVLYNHLQFMRELGIAPSNPQVRELLIPYHEMYLKDAPEVAEFEREVALEIARRKDKQKEEIKVAEEAPSEELLAARRVTKGKTALILGGVPKAASKDHLQKLLEFKSVDWIETRTTDTLEKLAPTLKRYHFVYVLVSFANHSWTSKRLYEATEGKNSVVLIPSGYGTAQMVRQTYLQATPEGENA